MINGKIEMKGKEPEEEERIDTKNTIDWRLHPKCFGGIVISIN